jgi:hypothetical protein
MLAVSEGPFGSVVLEVAIGMAAVFLMLSMVCSSINEFISRVLKWRSNMLEGGIKNMVGDLRTAGGGDLVQQFYSNPLIEGLSHSKFLGGATSKKIKATYIPARTFARAFLDVIAPVRVEQQPAGGQTAPAVIPRTFESLNKALASLPEGKTRQTLLGILNDSQQDLEKAQKNIEQWFDDSMESVSASYARHAGSWLFGISLVACALLNADSIQIAEALWQNPSLRSVVLAHAENLAKSPPPNGPTVKENSKTASSDEKLDPTLTPDGASAADKDKAVTADKDKAVTADKNKAAEPLTNISKIQAELRSLNIPIGWKRSEFDRLDKNCDRWIEKIFGIFFTTAAVSLGAPFWFELLNKLINLRSAAGKPKRSDEEKPATAKT